MNTYLRSLYFLFFLVPFVALGQTFDLAKDYGIAWNTYVPDISAKYTAADAKKKFPAFFAWWTAQFSMTNGARYTENNFMQLSEEVCAHNDAVWRAHAAGYTATCQSRSNVYDPHGRYAIDFPLMVAFGEYHGQGTSAFYAGGTTPQGGTELYVDHSGWMGDPKVKNIFQSNTWAREDLYSYNESFVIDGYRLVGMKSSEAYDASVESSGIAIWDAGSTSRIGRIFSENFNTAGIHLVRGTPAYVDELTTFRNNLAGVWLQGGGMHYFNLVEADENPTIFLGSEGHGRIGSSALQVNYVKSETGKAPGRDTEKWQAVGVFTGWWNANFGTISYAAVNSIPHTMFFCKFDQNSSNLKVENVQLFGPCFAWVQDAQRGNLWPITAPGGLNLNGFWATPQHGFKFSSDGTFTADYGGSVTPIPCAKNRMSGVQVDPMTGAPTTPWTHLAGTPDYPWDNAGSSPPPSTPCTGWTTGTWSTCTNGVQTRSVTPSPSGCNTTPPGSKPAESQTCTTGGGGSVKWTSPWTTLTLTRNGTAMDGSGVKLDQRYCVPVNATGVTVVQIKGLKCTELNWGRIVGAGGTSGGLQVSDKGEWWWANAKMNPQPPKVVLNVTADYTITIPSSTITAALQTSCGQGGAQIGTIGSITLK